ncbi:reductive dehalogenase [gamma proteobacterium NOR5-3]|nr:reductive dehalogenase [gamma proteobacterium NOR5-3]
MKFFSYRNRPVHLGPYPSERLSRAVRAPNAEVPAAPALSMIPGAARDSIAEGMDEYLGLLDSIRDGVPVPSKAEVPEDLTERSEHLKSAAYFLDASVAGIAKLTPAMRLDTPYNHPRITDWLRKGPSDKVHLRLNVAAVYQSMEACQQRIAQPIDDHSHALVIAFEYPRDPAPDEPGTEWISGLQAQRAHLRAGETATVLALYLRQLGFSARAHTGTSSDINLLQLACDAGIARMESDGEVRNPYLGSRFGLAAVTTDFELDPDSPLAAESVLTRLRSHGPRWWAGYDSHKTAFDRIPFKRRRFKDGLYPMETLKRVEEPTSFIDAERIPRVPKRTEFFVRIALGDLGEAAQKTSVDGFSVMKNPFGRSIASILNTYSILQRGDSSGSPATGYENPDRNADLIKAALYFLGADIVGISEAPDWAWYSHSADGKEMKPAHKYAITTLIDQGHETMEGASGDDWISTSQSMRSYMRASLLGGVVTLTLRRLGFPATNHTAADGDVLQPPLMLLAGLGEISRIGDLILNPFLGPRLKCGVVTTDMPLTVDKPIDFGLQTFCGNCKKCARECPSGAITAGEKRMFNGYEIWKPDAEKCARYRMTNDAGSMCGRCMKTCPWNLEGIFTEAPFRWLGVNFPQLAPVLTRVDDWLGNGGINPVKKWWWDLRTDRAGVTVIATDANQRGIQPALEIDPKEQTLACYPAELAPTPYPVPSPIDREAGIKAYDAMLTPHEYRAKLEKGDTANLAAKYVPPEGPAPVIPVRLVSKTPVSDDGTIVQFQFEALDGGELPAFEAGAHIDVMADPQFIRQYSLCGDPADSKSYAIGVLREDEGRGGSLRIHQRLQPGRTLLISRPRNHFPLERNATKSLLLAGGIGVTPMMSMAHELHSRGEDFVLYYKAKSRAGAAFVDEIARQPWSANAHFYPSDEDRLDIASVLKDYAPGNHLYTCGPVAFMDAVFERAAAFGWPEEALHREFFAAPEGLEYENHPFKVVLASTGKEIEVAADQKATEALAGAGVAIDTKCSDGICGVCATRYVKDQSDDIEHRDFVLSKEQREERVILCSSRAAAPNGRVIIDL